LKLLDILGGYTKCMITAVGAGGKTTFLKKLSLQLNRYGYSVISTTTTKIFPPEDSSKLLLIEDGLTREFISVKLSLNKTIYIGQGINNLGKVVGVDPSLADSFKDIAPFVLVEGDGADRKSFKAPADYEPVIPQKTDILCPIVGLSILGKPLTEEYVHRINSVVEITGLKHGDIIDAHVVASVLSSSKGYYKEEYKYIPVLNQADDQHAIYKGEKIANLIFKYNPNIKQIAISSLHNDTIKIIRR
jgi:probable selenium-dependent hydroxylase accessory protein YqeC